MSFLSAPVLLLLSMAPSGPAAANTTTGAPAPATTTPTTGAPAPAATTAPANKAERIARAAKFFEGGRYVEAALEFEGLRRDYPGEPSHLFNAAASRDAAGHHAHALAYTREYLARNDLGPDDRKQGEEQRDEAIRKITPVTVSVTLPPLGSRAITIVARHVASSPADLRPDLTLPLNASQRSLLLELDPGTWLVRAEGPEYQPAEQQVVVGSTPAALALQLQPTAANDTRPPEVRRVPPEVIRKSSRAVYITGGVVAAVGLGLVGGGAGMIHGAGVKTCDDPTLLDCRRNFSRAFVIRNTGTTVFGAGAGLAATGLVWRIDDARRRTIAWSSLAAVGGVGFIVGQVLVVRGMIPFSRDNTDPNGSLAGWSDHWAEHRHSALPALAATLRGVGIGLVAGSVTGLLIQRHHLRERLRVEPSAGPTHTGLTLSGRF